MDTNFEFSDFIENVNFDKNQTHSILDEIRYLVKKISLLEKKCKEVMLQAKREYPDEYPEPQPPAPTGKDGGGDNIDGENRGKAGAKENDAAGNDTAGNATAGDATADDNGKKNETKKNDGEKKKGGKNENVNGTPTADTPNEEDAPSPAKEEKILEPNLEKLITKMYKRIALKYHPDKCGDKYRSVFLSATEATEEKNLTKLLYIFALQEINMTFNEDELKYVEAIKIRLEQKLSMILSSPLTQWEILSERMKRRIARSLAKMG
jgi:hypothetical protein